MAVVYLGLGSNLEPEANLRMAVRELRARFSLRELSRVYRNAALGFDGDDFLNAVACIATPLYPQAVNL
jgi:2-amino-4-hydroxy-6-hydroxymethyldihydropteridine diphosphokinase